MSKYITTHEEGNFDYSYYNGSEHIYVEKRIPNPEPPNKNCKLISASVMAVGEFGFTIFYTWELKNAKSKV